jgi:hypothetical protein
MSQLAVRLRGRSARGLLVALALAGCAALPVAAQAQSALAPTAIGIGIPPTAQLGQVVALQARLVGAGSLPIAKATVSFTSPTSFLNVTSDAVIAEGVTDKDGLVSAPWRATRSGSLSVQAEFRGDGSYAPATARAPLEISGDQQLYVQQAGVRVPGLNTAPVQGISFLAALWPALSAWPIAAVLLVVWSLYATATVLLFRIAVAGLAAGGGTRQPEVRP